MNAFQIPNMRFSIPAGAAVSRKRFVTINAQGTGVQAAAGGVVVGASMNDAALGEVLEIGDGIVIVEVGAAVAAGTALQSAADGRAIVLTSGVRAGVAITGAANPGELISVKI